MRHTLHTVCFNWRTHQWLATTAGTNDRFLNSMSSNVLVLSLLMLLILVVYVFLAKHYKLRERDRHITIYMSYKEEHYERYFDQGEEYMREVANRY